MGDTPPINSYPAYATFVGPMNQANVERIIMTLGWLPLKTTKEGTPKASYTIIHLFFQSEGGNMNDSIALHNYFQKYPFDLTIYNCGRISSAGVLAYLGCRKRVVAANSSFMLHKVRLGFRDGELLGLNGLHDAQQHIEFYDRQIHGVLGNTAEFNFTPEFWEKYNMGRDVYLSAQEAKDAGLAQEIGDFSPIPGKVLFNI